jgi:hypothetical protein
MVIHFIDDLQAGHVADRSRSAAAPSPRLRAAPQWGQNLEPSNISAKHAGQLIVASRARQ